jgi:hypothetical protein
MLNFLKNIFHSNHDSKSALEKTIDNFHKELDEKKRNDLYMLCAEELLAGTSDLYLNHKYPTLLMTFARNILHSEEGAFLIVFTNKIELDKYTKKENPYTVIPSYQIFDLCLHFHLENIIINYKSPNSIIVKLDLPKKQETQSRDLYYDLVDKGPDAYIEALELIGWFNQGQKKKNAIREKLHQSIDADNYLLTLADIHIDGEGFEDIEAYKIFLNQIKNIVPDSKFSVINDGDRYILTFTIGKNRYEYFLHIDGEWFQDNILTEWINPALTHSNINENFYVLTSEDQCLYMVYVTNELYLKALENNVILPAR